MSDLTPRDRELVALGAAMGSHCVPCVEYHVAESRRVGLSDRDIHAAIQHADKIRQVPARRTLQAALKLLSSAAADARNAEAGDGSTEAGPVDTSPMAFPREMLRGMMTKMMAACGGPGPEGGAANPAEEKAEASPAANEGCGCG